MDVLTWLWQSFHSVYTYEIIKLYALKNLSTYRKKKKRKRKPVGGILQIATEKRFSIVSVHINVISSVGTGGAAGTLIHSVWFSEQTSLEQFWKAM